MRVFLLLRFPLQCRQYALQDVDFICLEDVGGFNGAASVAGQGQLKGEHRCLKGQTGQLGQPRRRFNLAGLKVQALLLQGSEQLFDVPALPVPVDALPKLPQTPHALASVSS